MKSVTTYETPSNQARSMVYGLLSDLFAREIDHQSLYRLTSPQAKAFFEQLASEPLFSQDVIKLTTVLNQLKTDKAMLELAADYCGLFLVGTKHSASPYASLYLNAQAQQDETLVFGEQHQLMLDYLKQSQLQIQSDFPEPADHIAVILAYVAHNACLLDDASQQAFIHSHLNAWLKPFADKVADVDQGGFYRALASFTLNWVESDCQALDEE